MSVPASGATSRAWIELHMDNLRHNAAFLRERLPVGCALMPAIKADAYGHGALPVSRALNRLGVDAFCVATAQEGAALRQGGVRGEILVLGYTPAEEVPLLNRCRLTQAVADAAHARELDGAGLPLRVQIAIDTGMHRLGERWENREAILSMYQRKHLRVDGAFTHLCAADLDTPQGRAYTRKQAAAFFRAVGGLRARGLPCPKAHLLNSYGLLRYPQLGGDYARVGIALYGDLGTPEDAARWGAGLRPVLSLKARVASVRPLHTGESAGYGLAYTADGEKTIAALTIGYADGLPRALSGGAGEVLIRGRSAPIVGRICMDQTLVDVTSLPGVQPGDTAVLIGRSGDRMLRASDMAARAGTIANEILCRLGPRLGRVIAEETG